MLLRLANIEETAIGPALLLLPRFLDTAEARLMLLAIGLQESRFEHRRQIDGPARGFWQFEHGGGVVGVFKHHLTHEMLRQLCHDRDCNFDSRAIYEQLEHDDVLAAGLARLLLYADPKRLPALGDVDAAWDCYIRSWRPGKPHPRTWPGLYAQALQHITH